MSGRALCLTVPVVRCLEALVVIMPVIMNDSAPRPPKTLNLGGLVAWAARELAREPPCSYIAVLSIDPPEVMLRVPWCMTSGRAPRLRLSWCPGATGPRAAVLSA
jgi:hypothetical protein